MRPIDLAAARRARLRREHRCGGCGRIVGGHVPSGDPTSVPCCSSACSWRITERERRTGE